MSGYIDLHCHYIPAVDDGVRSAEEGQQLLAALGDAGFTRAIATPHIRTAMFDNRPKDLRERFGALQGQLSCDGSMPETAMAAEHFFDDIFWTRFLEGDVCPYPGGKAILVEFPRRRFPMMADRLFAKMLERGVRPVLAHPERYQPVWSDHRCLEPLIRSGAVLLMDSMSLIGEYGRQSADAARTLLSLGWYGAACTDSHRPAHVERFAEALEVMKQAVGEEAATRLLREGPTQILDGGVPDFVESLV